MNLRQKVKRAKKELASVDKKGPGYSYVEIAQKVQEEIKLERIIDYKRKPSRHCRWNEKISLDWKKLTYVSVSSDFHTFAILKSLDGRPLKQKIVQEFLDITMSTKVYNYATNVHKKSVDENKKRRHIDYLIYVSSDKTKAKKFHMKKIFYQFEGDDKLNIYEDQRIN